MRSVGLAFWYLRKTFINSIKRSWKVFLVLGIIVVLFFGGMTIAALMEDSSDETDSDTTVSEEVDEEESYIPNEQLDFVWDDNGCIFYENGQQYEVGSLILSFFVSYVVLLFVVLGIVGGSKNGVSIFAMPDVNYLFPAPMKPQSVLLFKMICQIGTTVMGCLYIIYQMPNLVNNMGLSIPGALLIVLGYFILAILSKFISVFSYVFFAKHGKLKQFVGKYGWYLMALPIVLAALLHFVFGMGYYASVNAVFGSAVSKAIPIWGWLTAYTVYAISGNYLLCLVFLLLVLAGSALLVWGTWQMPCDFYEDAFEGAQILEDITAQQQSVANGGIQYGVKHEGKRQEKKWEKRRNRVLAFEGSEGGKVFFAKTIINRKRMYTMKGLWSPACSWYFWVTVGASAFMRWITGEDSALLFTVLPTALCLFSMFFRSFLNPLQVDLDHNFIYMIPESPFSVLGWDMAGQVLDGAIDLLPMTLAMAVFSLNPGYALCCGVLLLSCHLFFGMTALLVNLVISSYLPVYLSNVLQILVRVLPFLPAVVMFVFVLSTANVYMALIGVILINVCASLLAFIPCPFFLHKGKR